MSRQLRLEGLTIEVLIKEFLSTEGGLRKLVKDINDSKEEGSQVRGVTKLKTLLEPFTDLNSGAIFDKLNEDPYADTIDWLEEKKGDEDSETLDMVTASILTIMGAFNPESSKNILTELKANPTKELADKLLDHAKSNDFRDMDKEFTKAGVTSAELFKILSDLYKDHKVTASDILDTLQVRWGRLNLVSNNLDTKDNKSTLHSILEKWTLTSETPYANRNRSYSYTVRAEKPDDKDTIKEVEVDDLVGKKGTWHRLVDLDNETFEEAKEELKDAISATDDNIRLIFTTIQPLGRRITGESELPPETIVIDGVETTDGKEWEITDSATGHHLTERYLAAMREVKVSDIDLMISIGGDRLTDPIFKKKKGYHINPIFHRIVYGKTGTTIITNGLNQEFGKYMAKWKNSPPSKDTSPKEDINLGEGKYTKAQLVVIDEMVDEEKINLSEAHKDLLGEIIPNARKLNTTDTMTIDTELDKQIQSEISVLGEEFNKFLVEYNKLHKTNHTYSQKDPLEQGLDFAHKNKMLSVLGSAKVEHKDNLANVINTVLITASRFGGQRVVGLLDTFREAKANTKEYDVLLDEISTEIQKTFTALVNGFETAMSTKLEELIKGKLSAKVYEILDDHQLIQEKVE